MRKKYRFIAGMAMAAIMLSGCAKADHETKTASEQTDQQNPVSQDAGGSKDSKEESAQLENKNQKTETTDPEIQYSVMKVDESSTHQTWESFGASGCWWAQYVGTWDQPYGDDTVPVRDKIATYLFDPVEGIGLNCYRYNLGAGSADSGKGDIWATPRRAHSFETAPGEYNWEKDKGAYWFVKKATELGVDEVILFCNSPLERLTNNGLAHMSEKNTSNLAEENYDDFAKYVYDVAEHFVGDGIPVKFISPINEPQWDWLNGQEGCHYTPKEVAAVLRTFVQELGKRDVLKGIEITAPESGEWGGQTKSYINAILDDDVLGSYFKSMDCHSYWTTESTKKQFMAWLKLYHPDMGLRMSEWCEMVNGRDYTMDSAFNMADVVSDDLTILGVTSWQNWVAVADGDYRDGLIYVNTEKKACRPAKRLWGYGNYTRYIHRGYTRVDIESSQSDIKNLKPVAFTGVNADGKEELVMVFINREGEKQFKLDLGGSSYANYEVHTTSEQCDLEQTDAGSYTADTVISLNGQSITTVILK